MHWPCNKGKKILDQFDTDAIFSVALKHITCSYNCARLSETDVHGQNKYHAFVPMKFMIFQQK